MWSGILFQKSYYCFRVRKVNDMTKADFNRIIKKKIKEGYVIVESFEELPDLDSNTGRNLYDQDH